MAAILGARAETSGDKKSAPTFDSSTMCAPADLFHLAPLKLEFIRGEFYLQKCLLFIVTLEVYDSCVRIVKLFC